MPTLDYAFIADYARTEVGGVAHVLAVGIDTVYAPQLPAAQTVAVLHRILFTREECDREHGMQISFKDETDDNVLATVSTSYVPEWNDDLPEGWLYGVMAAVNIGVPLPHYGTYVFEVSVNDSVLKSIRLRVLEPPIADATSPRLEP